MEIIFEVIAAIVQFLLQVIWEVFLQAVFQLFAEALLHGSSALFQLARELSPWLAAAGYALAGILAGYVSLLVFPQLFVQSRGFQLANLIFMPVLCGAVMSLIGSWRESRGFTRIRMETFGYGALFSFAFSGTRFLGATHG